MKVRIGSSPCSWGVNFASDPKQIPWQRFLDELIQADYEWIELAPYGYLPTDPKILRPELERRNLKAVACDVMLPLEDPALWPVIKEEALKVGAMVAGVDGKYVMLLDDVYIDLHTGKPTGPSRLDEDGWKRLIHTTQTLGDLVHDRFGLELVFHPHVETHVEHEHQIEALLEQTDPQRVSLCLDPGHHAYGGGDPVAFLRKHHARIRYLHLKNVDRQIRAKVAAERIPLNKATEMGIFCEPAQGMVDFFAFRDALQEIAYDGWAIVEQDMYPTAFDKPLPIAKRTRAYLREIGIG